VPALSAEGKDATAESDAKQEVQVGDDEGGEEHEAGKEESQGQ
jgi:hypothetical protein